jgi:hypothetical protein
MPLMIGLPRLDISISWRRLIATPSFFVVAGSQLEFHPPAQGRHKKVVLSTRWHPSAGLFYHTGSSNFSQLENYEDRIRSFEPLEDQHHFNGCQLFSKTIVGSLSVFFEPIWSSSVFDGQAVPLFSQRSQPASPAQPSPARRSP